MPTHRFPGILPGDTGAAVLGTREGEGMRIGNLVTSAQSSLGTLWSEQDVP